MMNIHSVRSAHHPFPRTHYCSMRPIAPTWEQTSRAAFVVPEGTTSDFEVGFIFTTYVTGRCHFLLFRFFELFLCIHSRFIACHLFAWGQETLDDKWDLIASTSLAQEFGAGVAGKTREDNCRSTKPVDRRGWMHGDGGLGAS